MAMKLPQTVGERQQAARFIRETLDGELLRRDWLILQLRREGFRITPQYVSDGLALRAKSPRIQEFLARSVRICEEYLRGWGSGNPIERGE